MIPTERDRLLQSFLRVLADRGIASRWSESDIPYTALDRECEAIAARPDVAPALAQYLAANRAVSASVVSFLAHMVIASNIRVEHVPGPQQPLVLDGSRIARWVPTSLVIDGPVGRLLRASASPLNGLLRREHQSFPSMASARDLFNHELFREVRNALAHWSFLFQHDHLVCLDDRSSTVKAQVHLLEAEALCVTSFHIIDCISQRLLQPFDARAGA